MPNLIDIDSLAGPSGHRDENGNPVDYDPTTGNYVPAGTANYGAYNGIMKNGIGSFWDKYGMWIFGLGIGIVAYFLLIKKSK